MGWQTYMQNIAETGTILSGEQMQQLTAEAEAENAAQMEQKVETTMKYVGYGVVLLSLLVLLRSIAK